MIASITAILLLSFATKEMSDHSLNNIKPSNLRKLPKLFIQFMKHSNIYTSKESFTEILKPLIFSSIKITIN